MCVVNLSPNTQWHHRSYGLFCIEQNVLLWHAQCSNMHIIRAELLRAMKDNLRDLGDLKLLSPSDLDIIDEKRILRQQIAALENGDSDDYQMAAD